MSGLIERTCSAIEPPDGAAESAARARLDRLTKPRGSLGRLEDIAASLAAMTGQGLPEVPRKLIVAFAGDHGVAAQGVSAYPQAVTPQMVRNMLAGGAAVNVLARHAGAELRVVDVGVADPLDGAEGLVRRKVRPGTDDMSLGPAMSEDEARAAVEVGIELGAEAADEGFGLVGAGEMGIANTTAASALVAALLPCDAAEVTGRGTGIDDAALAHKVEVVRRALKANARALATPVGALTAVGGLEIAGVAGLVLGAASRRVPIVVDGFISSAGALAACRMSPAARGRLFFSHCSAEAGHRVLLARMGARPILDLAMRLGEGTGAALAMSVIEAAAKLLREMATFESAGVSDREA